MTKQVQRRRGTAAQHTSFTGAEGEISVNTTNKSVHVHDGVTAGGVEAARADMTNVSDANLNARLNGNTLSSLTITTADINGGTIDGTVIGGSTPAAISGTTGSFSGNLTVDTNTLFVNSSLNRVGVGTTSPNAQLHSVGADGVQLIGASGATQGVRIGVTTANGGYIEGVDDTFSASYEPLTVGGSLVRFTTSNTERMRITSAGSVGIGTSNPQSELDVFGVGDIIRSTANDGASNFMAFFDATGRKGYFGYGGSTDDMTVANERNGFLRFITNGSTRATITSSGDLGLGTTSPTERLDVSGNIIASGTSSTTKNILRTTSGQIEVRAGDTASFIDTDFTEAASVAVAARFFRNTNTTGAKTVRFHRGDGTATEDARIAVGTENTFFGLGGGSVGIGTSSPTNLLDVNADSIRVRTSQTPASASATGNQGEIAWDADYIYVCVATNTWKRAALTTW